jgi:hypothetical protein
MKRIALLVLVVAACKTSDSSPAKADPPAATEQPATPHAARPAPSLPGEAKPEQLGSDHPTMPSEDRPYGKHRDRNAKMDKDGDGVVSEEERAAAMKERAQRVHDKLDTNGDGKLTPDELKTAQGRMHFDDPATLDLDKNGEISPDELAAAMKARRDAFRDRIGRGTPSTDTGKTGSAD